MTTTAAGARETAPVAFARPWARRAPAPATRAMARADVVVTVWSVVGLLVVLLPPDRFGAMVSLPAVLGAPGWVLARLCGARTVLPAAALAVPLSTATQAVLDQLLLWPHLWHPTLVAAVVLAGAAVGGTVVILSARAGEELPTAAARPPGTRRRDLVIATALLVSVGLWLQAALTAPVTRYSIYGLPAVMPVTWYLGIAIVVCCVALTSWSRMENLSAVSALAIGALVLCLFGTIAVRVPDPSYFYTYKHLGVSRYIADHGAVDPGIDIYHRWPGFFALAEQVSAATGVTLLDLARWCEPFFTALTAALVAAVASRLTANRATAATATALFVCGNWVGQSYFSPQAMSFCWAFAVLLVTVLVGWDGTLRPFVQRVVRRLPGTAEVQPFPSVGPSIGIRPAWVLLVVLDLAIVSSHQLTPYVLVLQLGLLWIAGLLRRPSIPLVLLVLALAYLAPNLAFVSQQYGLLDSFDFFSNAQVVGARPQIPNPVLANSGTLLTALYLLLAVVAVVVGIRRGRPTTVLAVCVAGVAPVLLLFGQNYGGEALLRVVLFAVPWWALAATTAVQLLARRTSRLVAGGLALLCAAGLFIPTFYGRSETTIMRPGEVAASDWLYAHGRSGSVIVLAAPGWATRYGPRYPQFRNLTAHDLPNLASDPAFSHRQLGPGDVGRIVALIHRYSPDGYVALTTTQEQTVRAAHLLPSGSYSRLEQALTASSRFRTVYSNSDARIFQLVDGSG